MSKAHTDSPAPANAYPVFKGLGRKPTFMGVPTMLLLSAFIGVAIVAMVLSLAWWGLLFVVVPTIAIMTREDDRAFEVLALEFKTRWRNRNKKFWHGSSYAPQGYDHRRPWIDLIERSNK